jgi:NAD+ synthase
MNEISQWIKNYCKKFKIKTLVVGISGGIDSALVSTLCAETGLNTLILSLPLLQKQDQLERARNHGKWLSNNYTNVNFMELNLSEIFKIFKNTIPKEYQNDLTLANTKSRLRMVTLYQYAGSVGGIVVGTGNKIEDFGIGFFTKYGDGGVDISPIADLTKSEVKILAKKLNINSEIIDAPPTDGLWDDNRTDEQQIGASYEELEWAMNFLKFKNSQNLTERQKQVIKIYKHFNKVNKHKMKKIPIFKNKKNLKL